MNWNSFTRAWQRTFGGSPAHFVMPNLVLEFEPSFVAGARLDTSAHSVRRWGVRELAPEAVVAQINAPNIERADDVRAVLRGIAEMIGNGAGRIGLLLPDVSVRVAILTFETLPDDPRQAEALVRWRIKELLPYPSEEAKISYQVLWQDAGGVGVMVLAAKNSLLAEYVDVLQLRNGGPELILPATAALLPILPESGVRCQLLVHVCSGWVTSVVMIESRLSLWRTKSVSTATSELADQVGFEVSRILASCLDSLHVEPEKVWLCARPPATQDLGPALAGLISKEVLNLSPGGNPASALSAAERATFESVGAPVAGLLANVK